MRRARRPLAVIGTLIGAAVVLSACGFGVTGEVTSVSDVGARVSGSVNNTKAELTDYWFEYGTSTDYGQSTPRATMNVPEPLRGQPVSVWLSGLAEGTEYHYRLCTAGADGHGVCGSDRTFTTTTGRDSVSGSGTVLVLPGVGYSIGASVGATSGPAGANPVEGYATTSPGRVYFKVPDSGAATCVRVDGNRAAVGFVAHTDIGQPDPQPIPILLFVEDNGPSGDRIAFGDLAEPVTTCPIPTDANFAPFVVGDFEIPPVVTSGDFTIHDHGSG